MWRASLFFYYYERPTISFIKWRRAAKAQLSHLFLLYFIISIEIYFFILYNIYLLYSSDTHFYLIYSYYLIFVISRSTPPAYSDIDWFFFLLFGCLSAERAHTHKSQLTLVRIWLETGIRWLCRINSKAIDSRQLSRPSRSFIQDTFDRSLRFSLSLHSPSSPAAQLSGCFYRDEWARIHVPFTFCWVCVCVCGDFIRYNNGRDWTKREEKDFVFLSFFACRDMVWTSFDLKWITI